MLCASKYDVSIYLSIQFMNVFLETTNLTAFEMADFAADSNHQNVEKVVELYGPNDSITRDVSLPESGGFFKL